MSGDGLGWEPPERFEEYRLLRPLGRGAMGAVYLAHDLLLDRAVAVKFIGQTVPDVAARERFFVEARAVARLQHPNVVAVHRVGQVQGRPYLVAELIHGQTLKQVTKPLPWERVLAIGIGLARGLAAAHRRGVLHRDIKPANIMLTDEEEVKLLDFGVAKLASAVEAPHFADAARAVASAAAWTTPPLGAALEAGEETRSLPGLGHAATSPRDAAAAVDANGLTNAAGAPAAAATGAAAANGLTSTADVARPTPMVAAAANGLTTGRDAATPVAAAANGLTNASPAPAAVPFAAAFAFAVGAPSPSLTATGARVGTPLYWAPEIWRGEPASYRSDVYSLGAVLYELCSGAAAQAGRLAERPSAAPPPPLTEVAAAVDARLAAVITRCLDEDPARRFASGDELREALEQLTARGAPHAAVGDAPYRGLAPFEAEHHALFFGRAAEAAALVDRLRAEAFVLVAGDSGIGKSSLCRAGLLPRLAAGALGDGRAWSAATLVPGRRPLQALATLLAPLAHVDEAAMLGWLVDEPAHAARRLRAVAGRRAGVLVFVDQLEELATLAPPAEADAFALALAALGAGAAGLRVVATARGDFLTRLAALPGLGDELPRALYLLRPLSGAGLREAIVGPAAAHGVGYESETLVDTLARAVAEGEGGLPLLQFALGELWAARDRERRLITGAALAAIGGVDGALARHADGVLAPLLPRQRAAARAILVRLVTADGARERRPRAELVQASGHPGDGQAALEALVRGRLLVARQPAEGAEGTCELAHEALVSGWATLRGWLADDAELRAARERLERAATEWERLGHAREALWTTRQLAEIKDLDGGALVTGSREARFFAESRRAVRAQRLRRVAALLVAPLTAVTVLGAVRVQTRHQLGARVARSLASARAALSEAHAQDEAAAALRQQAFADFDAGEAARGERTWARALGLAAAVDARYGDAGRALETALMLDGGGREARGALADLLYRRALAAERDHRDAQRDEVIARLPTYDEDGAYQRRWQAPAELALASEPAGAAVSAQRYQDVDGRRQLGAPVALGTTPCTAALAPGSYLLTFTPGDRPPLRYPILAARGAREDVRVTVPASLPEGFIYVPPGRFLYGSSDDEMFRQTLLGAPPLHAVATGGFLINRVETTFADWIAFLRALLPEERARRRPQIENRSGTLALIELPDGGWQLDLKPRTELYRARIGEPIRYLDRERRAEQDWLRFPVSAISWDDAQAYLAWLDRSGRLPGARLCTEWEWERAARGADDRRYPHGDRLLADDANHDATYGRKPRAFGRDEVGAHPASDSPFGIADLAGNVWEWVAPATRRDEILYRGGSYYQDALSSRSNNHQFGEATLRSSLIGLRVCATR